MRQLPLHRTQRRVRWTPVERGLIALSLLLMLGSAGFEAYFWIFPPAAPAAPRVQEEATTSATATPGEATALATPEPAETAPSTAATETPNLASTGDSTAQPTATSEPETATSEPATATSEPATVQPATATVTINPGATLVPTFTPLPTLVIGEAPLVLEKTASALTVKQGEQFSFFILVRSASVTPRSVEVRDAIDSQLEVIEASSTSGTCSTSNLVVCVLSAKRDAPAQIIINVRVRSGTSPGVSLVSQALARDEQRETAASERVTVAVEGVASQAINELAQATASPTHTAAASSESKPEPRPTNASQASESRTDPSPTSAPTAAGEVAATPTGTTEPVAIAQASTVQAVTTVTTVGAAQPTSALPPTLAPIDSGSAARPVNPSSASPMLPHTAASVPTFGFGVGLLGLALTLHGTRRIRRANARLSSESAKLGQLSPLVLDAADFQHATVDEIERMRQQSEEMLNMLKH